MSTTLAPSLPPPPRPLHWTVAKFHQVNATGAFAGLRPVLIHGTIYEQGEMNPPHANALERTDATIRTVFSAGWRFRVQLPLVLGQDSDPFPDMAVIPGSLQSGAKHPTHAALVIEVSDTTLTLDLTEKAELYASSGIADYWVLDVIGRRLLVFRDPSPVPANGNSYRTHLEFGPDDTVSPLAMPGSVVRVADLLP